MTQCQNPRMSLCVASKELFGFVFGDKCGVVEDIAVSQNNQVIAYTGTDGLEA